MTHTEHDRVAVAVTTLCTALAATGWIGTASDLLAMLPPDLRPPSAAVLSKILRSAEADLTAAEVTVTGKRQPKTGARMIILASLGADIVGSNGPQRQPGGAENGKMPKSAMGDGLEPGDRNSGAVTVPTLGKVSESDETPHAGNSGAALTGDDPPLAAISEEKPGPLRKIRKSMKPATLLAAATMGVPLACDDTAAPQNKVAEAQTPEFLEFINADGESYARTRAEPSKTPPSENLQPEKAGDSMQAAEFCQSLNRDGTDPAEFSVTCARALARIGLKTPHPAIRFDPDGTPPPQGMCCNNCGGTRWWWCDGPRLWACGCCNPPASLPAQPPWRWVTT